MSSDVTRFATSIAVQLGWTAAPTSPDGHPLWETDTHLLDVLAQASEAALLTTPGGIEFIVAPRADAEVYRYLVGPLRPTDLPANAVAALAEWEPSSVLVSAAATPDHAADRLRFFLSYWEKLLTRTRAALEPGEAELLDHAFTSFTEAISASLPGSWTSQPLDLTSAAHQRLVHSLWSAGPEPGRRIAASAARAALLSGPRHRVLIVQDTGPYQGIVAAALRPPRPRIAPDSLIPGPDLLALPNDATEAARTIEADLLPSWDRAVFSARTGVLVHALVELRQALDSWDAVSDSYNTSRIPDAGAVLRDARAWDAVQVCLTHAPAVLNGIASVTTGADHLAGPLSRDLRTLDHVREDLRGATRIKRHWAQLIQQATAAEQPFLVEDRNADMWHHAAQLGERGDAVVRVARHVTHRIGSPPPTPKTPAPGPSSTQAPTAPTVPTPVRRSR
ncbi:hypothetical protein [Streptomyces acidiscabies]|uniref:hypothetical protein n=1 Tax=Streptomyces acidiscabies TaxID=42234 RepID=UPI000952302B|nr:hypothetical protein [Streptomyces acidiscabies]